MEIRLADDAAAEHYNAETREWVRLAQADLHLADAEKPEPVIPSSMGDAVIVQYMGPYVRVILPNDVPRQGQAGLLLRVRMALNEYEPGAFAVYAPRHSLTNVTYEVGALKNEDDELDVDIWPGTIEYTLRAQGDQSAQMLAQRIWPMYPVDIQKGRSHWFWLTLKTEPSRAKPGKYTGQITIRAEQGRTSLLLLLWGGSLLLNRS
jgi:hypothetical protein